MALRLSTGLRNNLLGTNNFKALFGSGCLDIYSGSPPSNADAAETGTLLARITEGSWTAGTGGTGGGTVGTGGLNFGTAANGVIAKNANTWSGTGIANGEAGWFRFREQNICTGTSSTSIRFDGVCAVSGGDLNISDLTITASATTTIDNYSITLPAQ
jgi:hypothetical protein